MEMDLTSAIVVFTAVAIISGLIVNREADLTSAILLVIFVIAIVTSNLIVNSWFDWPALQSIIVGSLGALLFMIILLAILGFIGIITNKTTK